MVHTQLKCFEAYRVGLSKLIVTRPQTTITMKVAVNRVKAEKSVFRVFLFYPENVISLLDPKLAKKYHNVTYEMYTENPAKYGVKLYCNKFGNVKYG